MLASEVMDRAAVLLNDSVLSVFTYVVQIPYLNAALDELQETFEQDNAQLTNKSSTTINVLVGDTSITQSELPTDLIEIQELFERTKGATNDTFQPMMRVEFLPHTSTLTNELRWWAYQGQNVNFIGANADREVKIDYVAALIVPIVNSTDTINVLNSKSFLAYRTAALCADFIGENPDRAQSLNAMASLALGRVTGINAKGRQSIFTRRRPFMAGFKTRSLL